MKAHLNVSGKKLEIVSISFYKGEVTSVMIVEDNDNFKTYYNSTADRPDGSLSFDLNKALEFPEVAAKIEENENKLIEHLVEMHEEECEELTGIAIDAMENKDSQPFNSQFIDSQKEYKLKQQRIMGIIDTIEQVRVFQESNNQQIEGVS